MSAPMHPRGAPRAAPVLDDEAWDAPGRLTEHDCLDEAGPDWRWTRGGDFEPESEQ